MKKLLTIMAAAALVQPAAAQPRFEDFIGMRLDSRRNMELLESVIKDDMKTRDGKRHVLRVEDYLTGSKSYWWTNGLEAFATYYDSDSREIGIDFRFAYKIDKPTDPITLLKVSGGRVKRARGGNSVFTVERIGGRVMLVERNAAGQPLSAYYRVDGDVNDLAWTLPSQCVLAGNYETSDGKHAVFGPKMPFYVGDKYDVDPGFVQIAPALDFSNFHIIYGDGRVSRGDPESRGYKEGLCGGGGAGALMPPMMWELTPCKEGFKVKLVLDHAFVDHSPAVKDNSVLTKVQSPYEPLQGKWAFASVFPLTHQLLRLFSKEQLTLMRAEIYARHGDTFANPDTQKYFDAQPWYKKSAQRIVLTDVERFNYALIKHVEQTKGAK